MRHRGNVKPVALKGTASREGISFAIVPLDPAQRAGLAGHAPANQCLLLLRLLHDGGIRRKRLLERKMTRDRLNFLPLHKNLNPLDLGEIERERINH
jgi:hypothetical protein